MLIGSKPNNLQIQRSCPGRVLQVEPSGRLLASRHYAILQSDDDGLSWCRLTTMPESVTRRLGRFSRLACRLLRHEVKAVVRLSDGTLAAANRTGVCWAGPNEPVMRPSTIEGEQDRVWPPMCMTLGPGDRIVWGEYGGAKLHTRVMRLFASDDGGRSFNVCHAFEGGEIRHVHNLHFDSDSGVYWVLVGDHQHEPGIGRLSADFQSFDWVVKGKQIYRAVCVFDLGDRLVYGTDSEKEPNAVMSLDKQTGRVERVAELPGSCIYAARFGGIYAVSTSVEPSQVNPCRSGTLWVSRDTERWTQVFEAPKDRWDERYFQFGSLVLPRGQSDREVLTFSGQALRGVDGRIVVATLPNEAIGGALTGS